MKKLLTATISILFLASLGFAATYDYEGEGTGDGIGDPEVIPWSTWEGTLNTSTNTFSGHWGGSTNSWQREITGTATWDTNHYDCSGDWEYENVDRGDWEGIFVTSQPSPPYHAANGDWWTVPKIEEGTFWGDLQ